MLLRRVCSSMYAGLSTGIKLLNNWVNESDDEEDDDVEGEKKVVIVENKNFPFT